MISEELRRRAQRALDEAEQLAQEPDDAIRSSADVSEILEGEVTKKPDASSPSRVL